jgi:hypothetical protein
MKDKQESSPIMTTRREAGFIAPLIGRTVHADVFGFPGFPLIRAGEVISTDVAERAQAMGRLFELTAATRPNS